MIKKEDNELVELDNLTLLSCGHTVGDHLAVIEERGAIYEKFQALLPGMKEAELAVIEGESAEYYLACYHLNQVTEAVFKSQTYGKGTSMSPIMGLWMDTIMYRCLYFASKLSNDGKLYFAAHLDDVIYRTEEQIKKALGEDAGKKFIEESGVIAESIEKKVEADAEKQIDVLLETLLSKLLGKRGKMVRVGSEDDLDEVLKNLFGK
jgi:hypothetical protein